MLVCLKRLWNWRKNALRLLWNPDTHTFRHCIISATTTNTESHLLTVLASLVLKYWLIGLRCCPPENAVTCQEESPFKFKNITQYLIHLYTFFWFVHSAWNRINLFLVLIFKIFLKIFVEVQPVSFWKPKLGGGGRLTIAAVLSS